MLLKKCESPQFHTEIIWRRTNAKGLAFRSFPNNHDSIFFYTAGNDFTFNRQYLPNDPKYVEGFYRFVEPETGRRYQLADLTNPNKDRPNLTYEFLGVKRVWRWTEERMQEANKQGLIVQSHEGAVPRLKRYLDEQEGIPVDSIWSDIPPVNPKSDEKLGYPTQKPLALLERIINASSNKGDIVLDAFCGCGTALVAAENLGRQWIGIDVSPTACRVMAKRLRDICGLKENEELWKAGRGFVVLDLPWTDKRLREIPPFEFENWAIIALGGHPNKAKVGDMGIDGRIYPVDSIPKKAGEDELAFMDSWWPVQVKQQDKIGRPAIDSFEAVLIREKRTKGYFVAFSCSEDALHEIDAFFRREHKSIIAFTVQEILDGEIARKLA